MAQNRASEVAQFFGVCLNEKGLKFEKIILFGSHAKGVATEEDGFGLLSGWYGTLMIHDEINIENITHKKAAHVGGYKTITGDIGASWHYT